MKKLNKLALLLFLIPLFTMACGASQSADSYMEVEAPQVVTETETVTEMSREESLENAYDMVDDGAYYADEAVMDGDGMGLAANAAAPVEPVAAAAAEKQERLIIRDASLELLVSDTEAAIKTITDMVESNGGWVVNSSVYQYRADAKTGNMTVRIPSDGFNSALEAVKGLAIGVSSESISGQDVTEEFVDLDARLGNLEATADRVRAFLDDAKRVEDALNVNRELSHLEGEIEAIKGRMKFLSESAAFSTINISLTPDIVSRPIEVVGWRPASVAREAVDALLETLQGFINILIWMLVYLLPLGLLVGLPLWFGYRFWRNRRHS